MRRAFFFLSVLITALILTVIWKQAPLAASSAERTAVETEPIVSFREVDHLGGAIRTVARENDFLYVARGARLETIDVSNPNHPRPTGEPVNLGSTIRDVAVHNGHIYAALGSNGLAVVVRDDQAQLQLLDNLTELAPERVTVDAGRLYVRQSEEVKIFGLSEPANPQELGNYGPVFGTNFAVAEGHIYLYSSPDLTIIDATDPRSPSQASRTSVGWIETFSVANKRVHIIADNQLKIIDVSDPSSPSTAGSLELPWSASDIVVMGAHAYLNMSGLYIVDVSDPAKPSAVGNFSTARHGRLDVGELFRAGDDLIVTDLNRGGLHLLDRSSNPSWPNEMGALFQPASAYASVAAGGKLYMAAGYAGVQVIDLSYPSNLQTLTQFRSPNWTLVPAAKLAIAPGRTQGIAISADHAYLANRQGGLHIADISSLRDIEIVSAFSRPPSQANDARDVEVGNGIAYVADGQNGLLVVDVSNPEAPEELATLDTTPSESSEATQISLAGSYLVLNNRQDGFDLYSLANPRQPTLSDQWSGSITSIAVRNPYVFAGTVDGLQVLRITADGQLQGIGSYSGISVVGMYVAGDELYLYRTYNGFQVLDISDPANPVLLGSYSDASGNVYGADEQFVYVGNDGLSALRRLPGVRGFIDGEGIFAVENEGITYTFDSDIFSARTEVRHTQLSGIGLPLPSSTVPLFGPFELRALVNGTPVAPSKSYTVTIDLPTALPTSSASALTLYSFDGEQWVSIGEAELAVDRRTVTAVTEQAGTFLLAANSSSQVLLPSVVREAMGQPDLSITGIEVTQASQTTDNNVPLTANRPTVARVYTQVTGNEPVHDVLLTLRGTRDGISLPGAVTSGPRAVFPYVDRDTPFTSFDIRLPDGWLQGNVTLTAEIDVQQNVPEVNDQNNTRSVTVAFTPLEPLRVVVVPVNYTSTANGAFCPAPGPEDLYSDGLQRLFPVHDVEVTFRSPINFSGDLASESNRLLERVTAVKEADDAPAAVVYYGVFSTRNAEGDYCRAGPAGMGWLGSRAAIGAHSQSEDEVFARDSAGLLAAHEFGHNFGLWHVDCPLYTHDDGDSEYPYEDGYIGQVGYDVLRRRIWSPRHPDYATEIMSYCHHSWFSDYHYTRLFQDQQANGRINTAPADSELLVRASISGEAAELQPTYVLTRTTETAAVEDRSFVVELLGEGGSVLRSHPVVAYRVADEPEQRSIFASLPLPDKPVAMVRLLHNGEVVASRPLSTRRAAQTEIRPTLAATDGGVRLQWDGTVAPVLVRYSTDGGATWITLAIDQAGGELHLDRRQLPDKPALFEIRPADSATLDAWTVEFMPAPETGDE